MITEDAGFIIDDETKTIIKTREIMYMSGFGLYGLSEIKPVTLILKNTAVPFVMPYRSKLRLEILKAVSILHQLDIGHVFFVTLNGHVVNGKELSSMFYSQKSNEAEPKLRLNFDNGQEAVVPINLYHIIFENLKTTALSRKGTIL